MSGPTTPPMSLASAVQNAMITVPPRRAAVNDQITTVASEDDLKGLLRSVLLPGNHRICLVPDYAALQSNGSLDITNEFVKFIPQLSQDSSSRWPKFVESFYNPPAVESGDTGQCIYDALKSRFSKALNDAFEKGTVLPYIVAPPQTAASASDA